VFCPRGLAADSGEALLKIDEAENGLRQAFVSVSAASQDGADVASLVSRLNSAGVLLSEAKASFVATAYDEAFVLSSQCLDSLNGIAGEADDLKIQLDADLSIRLFWSIAFAGIGLSILLVTSLVVWRFVRKRYLKGVLDLKPEAVSQ
jgi:hypothetical protein